MRIIHVITSLDESRGGAVRAVRSLAHAQAEAGYETLVVTLDRASSQSPGYRVVPLGPAYGNFQYAPAYRRWLKTALTPDDLVVIHGVFQYNLAGAWRCLSQRKIPYVVYPHGALDPWFRRQYPLKEPKKLIYQKLVLEPALRAARTVVFTSQEEARLAETLVGANYHATISPLGLKAPPETDSSVFFAHFPHLKDKRIWLFLGRLHPKKGADLLLEAFKNIADPSVHLVMAGPFSDSGHAAKLQSLAAAISSDRLTWTGMLEGDLKWSAFRAAEVFLLPSHTENFGFALIEALACGVPVLSTRKVHPWREIESDGAGWFGEDTAASTLALMERWNLTSPETRRVIGCAARACFQKRYTAEIASRAFLQAVTDQPTTRLT